VDLRLEWPSQSATFRMSRVAWRLLIAQVCRSTCGETVLSDNPGLCDVATCTYFFTM